MKGSLNIFKKATKHFKRIEKKTNLKLCHTQIGKLDHYNCIFLVVVAKSSLPVQKQEPWRNRTKKKSWTQGFEFLSMRKKVRPSAGKLQVVRP